MYARRGRNETTIGLAAAIWSAGYAVVHVEDLENLRKAVETSTGCAVCGERWRHMSRRQGHKPGRPCSMLFARISGEEGGVG